MDPMDQIRETFFQECEELMEVLEDGLNAMEAEEHDDDTVNAVFRAVHSVKGGAGAFGLEDLVEFAHIFETTLDEVRAGRLAVTSDHMAVFLRSADQLRDLIANAQSGASSDAEQAEKLIAELKALAGLDEEDDNEAEIDFSVVPLGLDFGEDDSIDAPISHWHIHFVPHPILYQRGNDCLRLVQALSELGEAEIDVALSTTPDWADYDPEQAYLAWTIKLPGLIDRSDIDEIFEFVEHDCELSIVRNETSPSELPVNPDLDNVTYADDFEVTEAKQTAPDNAIEDDLIKADENVHILQASEPAIASNTGNMDSKSTAKPTEGPASQKIGPRPTIRVDLDRVDRLINLIGELVINQSMLAQGFADANLSNLPLLADGLDEFNRLTRDIQEGVMAIRAQPVKPLFQRMSRIVREASTATGKKVKLHIEGEYTEVDKTIVESLADPLTHMIRNAVDHGLETPETRLNSGKPEEGIVRLSAMHRSGRVLIEVGDDGAGVNRPKVRKLAEEKGLVDPDAELSDSDIDNLLFKPGFSTAKEVSNLSGRGVGMDVVKRSIEKLGGRIAIASTPGKGSVFSISLPLTLAVLDGMIVRVKNDLMVIPIADIAESLKPPRDSISIVSTGQRALLVRGEFVPLIDISMVLGYSGDPLIAHESVVVLTETEDGNRHALLVDEILDQRQVVIKGLEKNYGHIHGIAAATILGDGNIALILDIDSLVSVADVSPPTIAQVA